MGNVCPYFSADCFNLTCRSALIVCEPVIIHVIQFLSFVKFSRFVFCVLFYAGIYRIVLYSHHIYIYLLLLFMSGRSRRDINKLDYKVLHLTGDKVSKSRDPVILKASGMDQIETIKMEEKLLIAEINDMIDISELLDEYEVDSYKEDLKAFRKKLRDSYTYTNEVRRRST